MRFSYAVAMLVLVLGGPAAARAQAPVQPATEEPAYDPYHAEKNIEVGQYYMKKGNYDAAIERFQAAARLKPNFAHAYHLLGEAYEKKGDKPEAVKAYRKYLEILPSAEGAGKVRKRIEKLQREVDRDAKRRSG